MRAPELDAYEERTIEMMTTEREATERAWTAYGEGSSAALREVDRLMDNGTLIHRDDADGLRAALEKLEVAGPMAAGGPDLMAARSLLHELVGMWGTLDRPGPTPEAWGAFESLVNRAEDLLDGR